MGAGGVAGGYNLSLQGGQQVPRIVKRVAALIAWFLVSFGIYVSSVHWEWAGSVSYLNAFWFGVFGMMIGLGCVSLGFYIGLGNGGLKTASGIGAACLIMLGSIFILLGYFSGDTWFYMYAPPVPGTPAVPGTSYKSGIQPLHCHQFSDCKYHDNCLWDEITSIIDGPQDYHNSHFYDKDPDIEMTEMMYGFIYLLHKYKGKTGTDKVSFRTTQPTDPDTIDSEIPSTYSNLFNDRYLKPPVSVGSATNTTPNNRPRGIVYTDIDGTKNLKKWTASWIDTSNLNSLVMKDNSGNKTRISELANEYGIDDNEIIEKVFWYYWSIFHDGTNGNLRTEVLYLLNESRGYKINQDVSVDASTKEFYDNLVYGAASVPSQNILGLESNKFKEEVRKCIPIIRLILKDWLNKNLVVKLDNDDLPGCEVLNQVCTYGVDKKTGECKESCDNDEILDYSKGLCYKGENMNEISLYTDAMKHDLNQSPPNSYVSFREFGPNFQRFYCELDNNGNLSDNFYQKSGCINNDLINNDAVRGEQCGDYYDRAEASGFNVDCQSDESIVHYDKFQQKPRMENLDCYNQFGDDSGLSGDVDKHKICGGDLSGVEYSWDRDARIDTGISKFTSYHEFDRRNQGEYSDVSPILSCCKNRDIQCLNGYWISDQNDNSKGYCSNNQGETFSITNVASKLNDPSTACELFGNVSGCPDSTEDSNGDSE